MIDPNSSDLLNALLSKIQGGELTQGIASIKSFFKQQLTAENVYRIGSAGPSSEVLLYEGKINVGSQSVQAGTIADDLSRRNSDVVAIDNTRMGRFGITVTVHLSSIFFFTAPFCTAFGYFLTVSQICRPRIYCAVIG
jgi:hypothetical protein